MGTNDYTGTTDALITYLAKETAAEHAPLHGDEGAPLTWHDRNEHLYDEDGYLIGPGEPDVEMPF